MRRLYEFFCKAPFILGYKVALDDIERTGLRPFREAEKAEAAERAWKRLS